MKHRDFRFYGLRESSEFRLKAISDEALNVANLSVRLSKPEVDSMFYCLSLSMNLAIAPLEAIKESVLSGDLKNGSYQSWYGLFARAVEALKTAEDALFLAFAGRYPSAFATLRRVFECIVNGALYHGLLSDEKRANNSQLRMRGGTGSFAEYTDRILKSQSDLRDTLIFEYAVTSSLEHENPPLYPPSVRSMLHQLLDWQIFGEQSQLQTRQFCDRVYESLYGNLSEPTHARLSSTYVWKVMSRAKDPHEAYGYHFNIEELKRFGKYFRLVVDFAVSLYIGSMMDQIREVAGEDCFRRYLPELQREDKLLGLSRIMIEYL